MTCVPKKSRRLGFRALPILIVLAVFACACAATSATVDAASSARRAVTSELRSRHGSQTSVTYVEHHVRDLGGDDREVTGRGFCVLSDSSDRHNFTYAVHVNVYRDDTWNLSIRMLGIDESRHVYALFEFLAPRGGDRLSGSRVRFFGNADNGEVHVDVYDRDDHRIAGETMSVRNGKWEGRITLSEGRYRAVANLVGTDRRLSASFSVGQEDRRLRIGAPRSDDLIDGPQVDIYGDSDSSRVLVQVYDRDDKRVVHNTTIVRDGRWSVTFRLHEGSYRVVVEPVGGGGRREVRFRVR